MMTDKHILNVLKKENGAEEELVARPYQMEMVEIAKSRDTILFLPTGSGKTYIAMMLIMNYCEEMELPFTSGGKRCAFLVNTVALVTQQKQFFQRHLPLKIGGYSGDMNVDFWNKATWDEELDKHQVVVMTAQILLNMLLHGYIALSQLNLVIFDECHHAVNDHAMRQIMHLFTPEEKPWPRILGLTATLLNGNCKPNKVQEELQCLETTYISKIATCEDMTIVEKFSTSPKEKLMLFTEENSHGPVFEKCMKMIRYLNEAVNDLILDPPLPVAPIHGAKSFTQKKSERRKILNIIADVEYHIATLGTYGGSRACLAHTIQMEKMRRRVSNDLHGQIYTMIINSFTAMRKLLEDEMSDTPERIRIFKYSSNKMVTLIELLRQNLPKKAREENEDDDDNTCPSAERTKKFCAIVFVERRYTAKIINSILQSLRDNDPEFAGLRSDFTVGFNGNPLELTREARLHRKWNTESLKGFTDGTTNLLVSSDVLEEGIDIPQCNLVIKYDYPKHYRSYVQSKGRARHKESKYIIMVAKSNGKFRAAYETHRGIEKQLQESLQEMQRQRLRTEDNDATNELCYEIPSYSTGTSVVTVASAIGLVNRYCSKLPQDKFTTLLPSWFLKNVGSKIKVFLQLPTNSPLKETIEGPTCDCLKMAKRAAALETCKVLHQKGLLNDHLLPVIPKDAEDPELFPLWEEEEDENDMKEENANKDEKARPGTRKKKRAYLRQYPQHLSLCKPMPNERLFLHVIKMTPVYPPPENNRRLVFYNLLKAPDTFAILSSKKLPKLCQFPIYMNVGELQVNLLVNDSELQVTAEELILLESFNTMIFSQLLKLMKQFLLVDKDNMENAFLVVPIKSVNTGTTISHIIDWDVVRRHQTLPETRQPSEQELKELQITEDILQCSLITPWYRSILPEQMYVVTRVCHELSPESSFPSDDFSTYADYFHRKYNLNILHKDQPLVEVKVISNKINFLRPRPPINKIMTSRRKRQELQEDFEENLVPELCVRFDFPSVLWVKATCLPTIIHRISYLLLAEEFRRCIVTDLGIGVMNLADGEQWQPLQCDQTLNTEEETAPKENPNSGYNKLSDKTDQNDNEKDIMDPYKYITEITLIELFGVADFAAKPIEVQIGSDNETKEFQVPHCAVKNIAILQKKDDFTGPQLCDILRALTTSPANDIVDMERLETLGDSFLKFSVSLFLFLYFPSDNEGKLTHLKGKIVGNRNLYYCGKHRNLNKIIKVHDFAPTSDWIPPSMCVPRRLQQILRNAEVGPNVLYELVIPREEQLAGKMSATTCTMVEDKLVSWEGDVGCHSSMENFLSLQTVPDKSIADCVEAVIGAYLQASGIRAALQVTTWFKILLPEKATAEWMFDEPPPSAAIGSGSISVHLKCVKAFEDTIHYTFRDKSFLLQALSHPSYQENRITECYQRLEYLGDAILDFLITCFIYETCGLLSPGKLTDLRSALVNNITFASLVVRYGLHKFMLYGSSKLLDAVDNFVKMQEDKEHVIDEMVLMLVEEEDCNISEALEVPKALGDLFEALAGAIYLDSGKDLNTVWRIFYPMLKQEIDLFSANIPINPVRRLYEMCSVSPKFGKSVNYQDLGRTMVPVSIVHDGQWKPFNGFGVTKTQAKRAAAKIALKFISTHSKKLCR